MSAAKTNPIRRQEGIAAGAATPAATTTAEAYLPSLFPLVQFHDGLIAMDVDSLGGDFNQFIAKLSSLGMQVTDTSSDFGIVEGYVPVAELPTVARLPQTESGRAIPASTSHAFQGYQGSAPTMNRKPR